MQLLFAEAVKEKTLSFESRERQKFLSSAISKLEHNRTELLHTQQERHTGIESVTHWRGDLQRQLDEVRAAIQAEIAEETRLRRVLVEVHQYGVMCHARAKELQSDIFTKAHQVVSRTAADVAAGQHDDQAMKATTQRLHAEAALLRAEVRRVEDAGAAGLNALTDRRQELSALELSLIAEVGNLTQRIAVAKNKSSQLQLEAQAQQGSEQEHMAETMALNAKVRTLNNRISPVVYAALEAENGALSGEMQTASAMLMQSKTSEARGFAGLQQATAEVEGGRNTAKVAADAAEAAQKEGEIQLSAAVKQAGENQAKAEAQLSKAMAVVEARCKPKWDVRKKKKDAELAICKQIQGEYDVASAQMETLKQTLKAQATVSAAVDE